MTPPAKYPKIYNTYKYFHVKHVLNAYSTRLLLDLPQKINRNISQENSNTKEASKINKHGQK